MTKQYLLIDVGCIECGEDTDIGGIVVEEEIPENYRIVQLNAPAGVNYSQGSIAVELAGI